MRILHVESTSGVPQQLAAAQSLLGHEVHILETWRNVQQRPHDLENYYRPGWRGVPDHLRTAKISRNYDVIHIHSGMNRGRFEALAMRYLLKKPIIAHYHGPEVRLGYGMRYGSVPHRKIVATPDLLHWLPDADFIPNPISLLPYRFDDDSCLRVVHVPSIRARKGTNLIIKAMKDLQDEMTLDFRLIEDLTHEEAIKAMSRAHLVIDQVVDQKETGIPGLFGMVSLEAMSMGKACICHLDKDMLSHFPNCPITNVEVSSDDLKDKVRFFAENMNEAKEEGMRGRRYVQQFHDPLKVSQAHLEIYEDLIAST